MSFLSPEQVKSLVWHVMLAVVQQGEQRAHIRVGIKKKKEKKKTVPGNVIHLSIRPPIRLSKGNGELDLIPARPGQQRETWDSLSQGRHTLTNNPQHSE